MLLYPFLRYDAHMSFLRDIDAFVGSARRPLIVVLGPTASGKTMTSLDIAEHLSSLDAISSVEIVNADSRQCYALLDIGTAKILPQDMRGIPHHMLSVLDPRDPVTIAWYQGRATQVIDDIHSRGGVPLLVGGSMLYISSIVDGLIPQSPSNVEMRQRLQAEYDADSGITLHAKLAERDANAAAAIPRQNAVYLIRAMEGLLSTGMKKKEREHVRECPYDLCIIGIGIERALLNARINDRTRSLLSSGWIEEVINLRDAGYRAEDPGMQSLGYREILTWLRNGGDLSVLQDRIASRTRQYAKRQMTWWRGDNRIHWIEPQNVRQLR